MTIEMLSVGIDWDHVRNSQMLHWVRVVPDLNFLSSEVSACFCSSPIVKYRMCERQKTIVQLLGINDEREIET